METPEEVVKKTRPFFLSYFQKLASDLNTLIDASVVCTLTGATLLRGEEDLSTLFEMDRSVAYAREDGLDTGDVHLIFDVTTSIALADLMMMGGKEIERSLTRLLQRGRGAGIHIVACVQKPTVAIIGSLVKSNFPVRIVGSVASPEDAKVASGLAGTGAERLLGRGDFLVVAQGQVMRLQAAYVSSQEIQELTARLREGGRQSRRWLEEATGTDGRAMPLKRLAARLKLVK